MWNKFSPHDIAREASTIDWNFNSASYNNVELMWQELYSKLVCITEKVPKSTLKLNSDGSIVSKPPWLTSALKRHYNTKEKAWRHFMNSPTSYNLNVAQRKEKYYEEALQKALIRHEYRITSKMKSNPKSFFAYLNSKRKIKDQLSAIKSDDGSPLSGPKAIADELGKFFESTFVNECVEKNIPSLPKVVEHEITELHITISHVKQLLSTLNVSKTPGPDDIHPKLLRALSDDS